MERKSGNGNREDGSVLGGYVGFAERYRIG